MSKIEYGGYTNTNSPEIQSSLRELKQIDMELAYLALLTAEGLKPLSRWEKPLSNKGEELLGRLDLLVRKVRRHVKNGPDVIETIFSQSGHWIDLYEKRFGDKPVDKLPETQRFEGFVFGYPACCVEQYIRKPYSPNNFKPGQQKLLFHWACQNCTITRELLSAYEGIYIVLENI